MEAPFVGLQAERRPSRARALRSTLTLLACPFGLLATLVALSSPAAGATAHQAGNPPGARDGSYACDAVGKSMVNGTPDIAAGAVPAIRSVQIAPSLGGLLVQYKFRKGFAPAPEGVYFAWTIYIYHHRADANNPLQTIELQIEDRGLGWEPTGWSVLASTYYSSSPVPGDVRTDATHNSLATFFPGGFANLSPPFYWYASQEVFRSYLPTKSKLNHQDFSINGSIVNDCPSGVRADPYSLPNPQKLLNAP